MNSTFAYPLPNRYQNIINSLIKHIDMDVVSGLSRLKQGFHSPPLFKRYSNKISKEEVEIAVIWLTTLS